MMDLVIIGGTFNPPHIGHLFLAEEVRDQLSPKKILFVPSNKPAHKEVDGDVSPEDRLEMLKLSLGDLDFIEIEKCEIMRGGISYSIDTLDCVWKKFELNEKPGLLIGDDLFESFPTWRNPQEILSKSKLIIAHRLYNHAISSDFDHIYLQNKIWPLSSSEIRLRVREGKSIRYMVPPAVEEYILDKKLYKD